MNLDLSKMLPMGLAVIVAWTAGVALGYIDALGLGPASVALLTIAVIVFLGMLRAQADMRTAITATFVVVYFALLAALATSERTRAEIDSVVGQELWDNFTYLVGVIVLFYFGATAAIEITKEVKGTGGSNDAQATPPAAPADPAGQDG